MPEVFYNALEEPAMLEILLALVQLCQNGSGLHSSPPRWRERSTFPAWWFLFGLAPGKAEWSGGFYQHGSTRIASRLLPTGFPMSQKKGGMDMSTSWRTREMH